MDYSISRNSIQIFYNIEHIATFYVSFYRLIGSIPGPMIFGQIIDQSCILSKESGNCLVYNNYNMSIYMLSVTLGAKSMGLIFIILTLISSKSCKIKDEEPCD